MSLSDFVHFDCLVFLLPLSTRWPWLVRSINSPHLCVLVNLRTCNSFTHHIFLYHVYLFTSFVFSLVCCFCVFFCLFTEQRYFVSLLKTTFVTFPGCIRIYPSLFELPHQHPTVTVSGIISVWNDDGKTLPDVECSGTLIYQIELFPRSILPWVIIMNSLKLWMYLYNALVWFIAQLWWSSMAFSGPFISEN